jgi:glutathione S-transferase
MKLYYDPITVNCRKVVAGFGLMGVSFEKSHVDYFTGGQKAPEYLKINPNGSLPALVDGDFKLWESNAILQYAADKNGATAYYPSDPKVRADINRWLLWEAAHWFPSCYVYLVENVVKPLLKAEPDQAVIDKEAPNWHRLANILDERLSNQRWLCGDQVTLADIAVAAPMHLHSYQKLPLNDHPNLRRWMIEGVEQLPCWKATDAASLLGLKA